MYLLLSDREEFSRCLRGMHIGLSVREGDRLYKALQKLGACLKEKMFGERETNSHQDRPMSIGAAEIAPTTQVGTREGG